MKKYFNTRIAIALAGVALVFSACADADKVFDSIQADVTRGAVLRGLEVQSNQVAINTATNTINDGEEFAIVIQEQDQENGALLEAVEVYVGYSDNTSDGANDKSEVLFETIPAASFAADEFGLPRLDYSVSGQAMQSAVGLADADLAGGDNFTVRFELVLTDGRRFTDAQNSGTITGSFFSSPFLYNVNVVCAPSVPTPGDWVFEMQDSYGDGWNGAYLSVMIDGTETQVTIEDGSEDTATVNVPDGTQVISIMFVSGPWDVEISYQIFSANGNEVASAEPSPPAGVELLDYCPNNL